VTNTGNLRPLRRSRRGGGRREANRALPPGPTAGDVSPRDGKEQESKSRVNTAQERRRPSGCVDATRIACEWDPTGQAVQPRPENGIFVGSSDGPIKPANRAELNNGPNEARLIPQSLTIPGAANPAAEML
jgi:hypothetical protein